MSSAWLDPLLTAGRHFLRGAGDLVYPGCCLLCGASLPSDQPHFCGACRHSLFTDPHSTCPHCAGTIGPFAASAGRCRDCRDESFHFEQVVRLGAYGGLLREVILQMKRQSAEGLAELVGECWAEEAREKFQALQVDAVVAVPLHWLRRWHRGYNQSAALAHGLATRLRLPWRPAWLRRIRNTPQQSSRTVAQRKVNVRGAFRARKSAAMQGRSVLLVDDVMTTGATVSEAAKALRDAGASRVVIAVLARAQG